MKSGDTLLLIFCLALGMAGSSLIGVGVHVIVAAKAYLSFLSGQYLIAPVFIIILGTLFFLSAFFRVWDLTKKPDDRRPGLLAFLLFIILIGNISAGIASFILRDNMYEAIKTNMHMQNGMTNYTATWDLVQENFKCCGLEGKDDWNETIPDSCCVGGKEQDCGKIASGHGHELYEEGCLNSFTEFFRDNLYYVGVTAFCVAAVEVLGICLSCGFVIYAICNLSS